MIIRKKIRIGVLFQNDNIPAWIFQMLTRIIQSESSEIVLIIEDCYSESLTNNYGYVYNLYQKLDRKFFKVKPDAFKTKSLKTLLKVDQKSCNDIDGIKKYNLDIIIPLEFKSVKDEIKALARYGVWTYYYGEDNLKPISPPNFWEVIERYGEVRLVLTMQEHYKTSVLITSKSLTDNLSVQRSKNTFYWKAASMLPMCIDKLYSLGEEVFLDIVKEKNMHPLFFGSKAKLIPSNRRVAYELFKFELNRIKNIIESLFYTDQWILLFHIKKTDIISTNLLQFKKIFPPKDRFWADPHVIKKKDTYYIFIEELIYSEDKGFISVIEMDSEGNYKEPVKVLETDYHLSFPFIFEDDDVLYMIPESNQNRNIQLYKCVEFPYKWELESVLIENVNAVDTVVTKKDGKYWLFTNMIENEGASLYDELYLFSSDNLVTTDWKSHPKNPIVSNVKNARMAGKIFNFSGSCYRPSQNCSKHYGYGMRINLIEEMDENDYQEKLVNSIFPDWDVKIKSTHSISNDGNLTVIDAQYKRRNFF